MVKVMLEKGTIKGRKGDRYLVLSLVPSPTTNQVIILKPLMSVLHPPRTQSLQLQQQAWKLLKLNPLYPFQLKAVLGKSF
jgi:hypothetical protein